MAAESSSLLRRLLLGPTPKRQARASQSLLALAVYVAFAGLQQAEVLLGLIDPAESAVLSFFFVGSSLLFYALIRSGLSERWAADPALTVPPMVLGFVAAAGSYASTGQALSRVLIDIGLFKRVNDQHGHAAGDAVLKAFVDAAQAGLRASDVLSRWGGEEFLLMLPDTAPAPAQLCIERVRALLAQVNFDAVAPGLGVTFSAGLAVCGQGETHDAAIERADQAMYRAKTARRNCTVVV